MTDTCEVIIQCGFYTLHQEALLRYNDLRAAAGQPIFSSIYDEMPRDDPLMIQTVKEFQDSHNHLIICQVPIVYKDTYQISNDEYHGGEEIICDPGHYVMNSLDKTNFNEMGEADIRLYLEQLKTFIRDPPRMK